MLNQRIGIFVSLPLDKLDKLALQEHLDYIGGAGRKRMLKGGLALRLS